MSAQTHSFENSLADVVVNAIKLAVAPLQARIAALEARGPDAVEVDLDARVKALEDRPALAYGGVFEQGIAYRAGTLLTRNGGLWLVQHDTRSTPGSGESACA